MKFSIFAIAIFSCAVSVACPDLSGKWNCHATNGLLHTEAFEVKQEDGASHYYWHHDYDNSDTVVIADNIERITNALQMGDYSWIFKESNSCPNPNGLLRHQVGERSLQGHFDAKTKSDQIITLQSPEQVTMITNSVDYNGEKSGMRPS